MDIVFPLKCEYNSLWFLKNNRGEWVSVEEENKEQQYSARENRGRDGSFLKESHPWLAQLAAAESDAVDEVIVYTLDEIRFA